MSTFIESVSCNPSSAAAQTDMKSGRTGRAGNQGLATSFYNEQDEHMAPFLAKILVENKWEVPDFLEEYKPADEAELDFEDDSGDEENEPLNGAAQTNGGGGNGDGWGTPSAQAPAAVGDSWGASKGNATAQTNGFAEREDRWDTGNTAAAGGGW